VAAEGFGDSSNCSLVIASQPAKAAGIASRILPQTPTQTSQINTFGPAINFLTWQSTFPDHEGLNRAGAIASVQPRLPLSGLSQRGQPDRPQHDALRDFAGRDHAPQPDEQFAGERDNHLRLACAGHVFLRWAGTEKGGRREGARSLIAQL
jgi:hypothetical protein